MRRFILPLLLLSSQPIVSDTIEEKRDALIEESTGSSDSFAQRLAHINQEISLKKVLISEKFAEATSESNEQVLASILNDINTYRDEIEVLETEWHRFAVKCGKQEDEGYALWDQEDVTLSQLVMEYGSSDYLYVIPPELDALKLRVHSDFPVPRESWSELLEIILAHNGIGIKQINPFTRQLHIMKQDISNVQAVITSRAELMRLGSTERVIYIFAPVTPQLKDVVQFMKRFRDPKQTFVYAMGHKVALVASRLEVEKLLSLYDTVWESGSAKISKVLRVSKISVSEMEKILKAYFGQSSRVRRLPIMDGTADDLVILPLAKEGSIALIGVKDIVEQAEEIVKATEKQVEDPCEMTIYWYTCRHSDPIEVSEMLEKVYSSLIGIPFDGDTSVDVVQEQAVNVTPGHALPPGYVRENQPLVVNPKPVGPTIRERDQEMKDLTHFIPYPKTGAIMAVVRRDTLDKIKELLERLDVPKKMVQIEVLLFEKKINNQNNFGLNLLKIGQGSSDTHNTGASYNGGRGSENQGILQFFLSRKKSSSFPAFDIAYNFLLSQENIRINSAPSAMTLNQVPAQVSIVEEISINNGAAPVDTQRGTIAFEKSFSRAQYGTTIEIIPTIHEREMDGSRYVTLDTDVNFDTTERDENDRPNVNRRHLKNQVRVLDGETVILGGLRRKRSEEKADKIPFLGELPLIGKFFGTSRTKDQFTEMFIFITPKVVPDPKEELRCFTIEELKKRPGDLPEFIKCVVWAKSKKRKMIFAESFNLLFGHTNDRSFCQ